MTNPFILPFPPTLLLMNRIALCLLPMIVLVFVLLPQSSSMAQESPTQAPSAVSLESVFKKYRQRGEEKWASKIQELEKRTTAEACSSGDAILFFGSSSIRRWDTMSLDMVPYPSINCGYGGAKYVDMVLFAKRICQLYPYRALVLFAANDVKVTKDGEDKHGNSSPEEVRLSVEEIIHISKSHRTNAPIFIIEVTPTESRFAVWDQTRKINATLREIALTTPNTWFISTAQEFLHTDGTPNSAYFVDDKLHLNEKGYAKWAKLIKDQLDNFLEDAGD